MPGQFAQTALFTTPWFFALLGAALAGVVVFIMWRLNRWADATQRAINKLENHFARMGSTWMSELLEDLVVGDEAAIIYKGREIIEAANTEAAIVERIAKPIAFYLIDFAKRTNDTALIEQLKKALM